MLLDRAIVRRAAGVASGFTDLSSLATGTFHVRNPKRTDVT